VADRAVLVTGASRGIGRAIAQAFAAAGDRVAVHGNASPDLAEQVRAGLPGHGHTVVAADLADAAAVRQMVDQAHADLGGLDVLVSNAGIYLWHPITEVSYEEWQQLWQQTLAVNLTGAANVTWCAVQYLRHTGGRIINVTSRGAYRGEPRHPAYGASKAGLNSFGQSMARALAPLGIAVASVAPGYVASDMTNEELATPVGAEFRAQSPFGRVAEPEEIAAAVLYLASAEAQWASGAVLDLNGASYLRLQNPAPAAVIGAAILGWWQSAPLAPPSYPRCRTSNGLPGRCSARLACPPSRTTGPGRWRYWPAMRRRAGCGWCLTCRTVPSAT
jgi:3-oxoacyl-[acyl-carrier protein] reductase